MKRKAAVFLFFFAGFCLASSFGRGNQELTWNIKLQKGMNWSQSLRIDQPITLEAGEAYRILITPAVDCYCYVLVYDSEGYISVKYNNLMK